MADRGTMRERLIDETYRVGRDGFGSIGDEIILRGWFGRDHAQQSSTEHVYGALDRDAERGASPSLMEAEWMQGFYGLNHSPTHDLDHSRFRDLSQDDHGIER
jgi:hypothetical protein